MKVKLKDICEIQSGGTPNRTNKQYWDNGTINWAKISDIKDKYLFNTEEKITEEGLKNSSAKLFKKNSILYTIFATLGEVCILGIDTTTNQAIANLEIRDKNVDTEYIYYYLLSKKKLISGIGRGVAQNNINLSILKEMEINLIDITIQKRIVDILNKNENIINKYKKQIALFDTLIKARFVEMFGGLNEKKMPLKEVANSIVDGSHNPSHGVDYVTEYLMLSSKNINNNELNYDSPRYLTKDEYEIENNRTKVEINDVLLTIVGTVGRSAIVCNNDRITFQRSVAIIKPKTNILNSVYLKQYFDSINNRFEKYAHGVAQVGIYLEQVRNLEIVIPPLELQDQFATFVQHIDKLKFE